MQSRGVSVGRNDCQEDGDCVVTSQCSSARCEMGQCVVRRLSGGSALPVDDQVLGDCRSLVCDGMGRVHSEDDDADKPDGDGNPCHDVKCEAGALRTTNMADGSSCNNSGTCMSGQCSQCVEGAECPRANDCTVFRWTCKSGVGECEDTGVPREGRACEQGKVCSGGSCVPCVVGGECDVELPCHTGRRVSCSGEMECEPMPGNDGMTCGTDAMGRTLYCSAGECTLPCREGPCMSTNDPCMTSHWDCASSGVAAQCLITPAAEGSSCGDHALCHDGACVRGALVNGDFSDGLTGWTLSGDAAKFLITPDTSHAHWRVLSTSTDEKAAAAQGSVSQSFVVPSDALALRFNISGGHGQARLRDESGMILEECTASDSNSSWLAVSWNLESRRGQTLTLSIDDNASDSDWAYIRSTGFDVIREVETPIRNSQFARGLADWETSGDAQYFNVYSDYSAGSNDELGVRMSVSTYARAGEAARMGVQSRGVVSQSFLVPPDAVAIRFNVCGGADARVGLYDGETRLYTVSAVNNDAAKIPVSWNLKEFRGKMLRIAIEDNTASVPYGYIGASSFDVITSYNGP